MYRHGLWLELEGMREAAVEMYGKVVARGAAGPALSQARWRLACTAKSEQVPPRACVFITSHMPTN